VWSRCYLLSLFPVAMPVNWGTGVGLLCGPEEEADCDFSGCSKHPGTLYLSLCHMHKNTCVSKHNQHNKRVTDVKHSHVADGSDDIFLKRTSSGRHKIFTMIISIQTILQ